MTKEVTLTITIPIDDVTEEQIREWIEFETGYCASMSANNPLCEYGIHGQTENCIID